MFLKKSSAAAVALYLAMAGGMMACKDEQVKTLAKTTRAVYDSCEVIYEDVVAMSLAGRITKDQETAILTALKKILIADKAANAMVEPLVNLDPKTKVDLLRLMDPVLVIIDDVVHTDLVNIKDEAVRNKISTALAGIRLSIQAALMVLK